MSFQGTSLSIVRTAIENRDPLPGTGGFAGEVDGRLVRDVLGREPLFVETSGDGGGSRPDHDLEWAFDPASLESPTLLPAGSALDLESPAVDPDSAERIWSLPEPTPLEVRDAALEHLGEAIPTASEAIPSEGVAVAFSGGIDSALVAALLDAPLYAVGFPDSHDLEAARTAAEAMGRELTVVELEPADLERAVPAVVRAIGRTNAMDVQIALGLYLVAERVAADGFDQLAVGQGADELFGGYEKVVRLDHRVEATTVRGAVRESIETLPDQLPRDVCAIRAAGVEPVAPLLHDDVVEAALRLPDEFLADDSRRKKGLRAVAADYLPKSVVDRDKKAVQYGSLVARELDRLARQAGYKRRMDDHVTKYIESLLEESEPIA